VHRILLTGMSGAGKSTVVRAVVARGHRAVDTDDGWCEALPDGRQRWREDAVRHLLDTDDADVLFLAGCEENQVVFHHRFDLVVLLTAPLDVLTHRVDTRSANSYGRSPTERRRFLEDLATVEPLLRRVADHTIDTSAPLDEVVERILALVPGASRTG
jgi:shikimate kinase